MKSFAHIELIKRKDYIQKEKENKEMKCPNCGIDNDAVYVGFSNVECPNIKCSSYKPTGITVDIAISEELKETAIMEHLNKVFAKYGYANIVPVSKDQDVGICVATGSVYNLKDGELENFYRARKKE